MDGHNLEDKLMTTKAATSRTLRWRERTRRRRVEVWLPPDVAEALDALVQATGAAGRGEVIGRLVVAAQARQGADTGPAGERLEALRALVERWEARAGKGPRWAHALELLAELREALRAGGG